MSSSYEKSVKGATKIKLAPPKSKYIEHILQATRTGEAGVGEVFRSLQFRLRDSTWTIAFKALIVVHLMVREGQPEITLRYLAMDYRKVMAFSTYSDVQTQGRNIRCYSTYLIERARSYGKTKQDYVGGASDRLKRLSVDKGLLRETESVQEIIHALVKCDLFNEEPENEITLTAFRQLTLDLLTLFQVMNEATINILEHYFEMSRPDAERALSLYKQFSKLTERVVRFLSMARSYEHAMRFEIPRIKHAPTSLTTNLEEYLNDKDFEINRRQYLAQQEAKRTGKPVASSEKPAGEVTKSNTKPAFPDAPPAQGGNVSQTAAKGPSPDLIDFFGSIEQNQQPMAQNPAQFQQQTFQPQFTNFPQQQQQQSSFGGFQQQPQFQQAVGQPSTNPFNQYQQQPQIQQQQPQVQPQATGAGFGSYTTQQQQQQPYIQPQQTMSSNFGQTDSFGQLSQQSPQQQQISPQATNPFRQSMMPQATAQAQPSFQPSPPPVPQINQPTGTNPFSQQAGAQQGFTTSQPMAGNSLLPFQQSQQGPSLVPQRTGTNPFARTSPANNASPSQPPGALVAQATGSTNPFRQSTFVNQQSGLGWQAQQGTMGGLENLETKQVFPRPGQAPQPNQGGWM